MPLRRHPVRYTLWLARTGAAPKSFSLPAWVPLVVLGVLVGWSGLNLWLWHRTAEMRNLQIQLVSLSEQARKLNNQLAAERTRNNALSQDAKRILRQIELLEQEINALRERAGMPKIKLTPTRNEEGGRGGAGVPAGLEEVLKYAAQQTENLGEQLSEVSPALHETLRREAATPYGYPLRGYTRITSYFGYRRNPFGWGFEFHNGVDFSAPYGSLVQATGAGVVVEAGWKGPFGLAVVVDHGYGYRTLYGHLSSILVRPGHRVERGTALGRVGSTGRSTGPHLHYTVYRYGSEVNPSRYLD
ncbi:Murein DD-endopeptidase MepM [Meiothermus luteus]|jgi:murein DD-endopeptidase MepM/ murein hydrolase activator NlpD|uniref:Murein DD-endopeptidase MepM n=1 Tax=Meiothermus luteus TaxID=2026184 RepID=A0A399ERY4_9DEIN|nr:peptidoglycan DD-metalloendopeptidase family protein [Meiothermus luteus]RIH87424.1 Murein DD-endopeptidase MepM [Meiothermus luteus]